MTPTDEQVTRAITAFDETWRKRPDVTVKNFHEARRDSMRAALQTVTETPPHRTEDMTEGLAEKLTITDLVKRLTHLAKYATPAPWGKGISTHHTIGPATENFKDGYPVATFKHADDAELVDLLRNNLDTIISALSGDGMGWRPIETAPKDGTKVLAYCENNGLQHISVIQWIAPKDAWRHALDGSSTSGFAQSLPNRGPTHWMPLPASPALTNDKEGWA